MKNKHFISLSLLLINILTCTSCSNITTTNFFNHVDNNSTIKKGIGVSRYNNQSKTSGEKINNLEVGWYYNWGITDPDNDYINSEYVPMMWGRNTFTQENINKIKDGYQKGKYKYLLTFNEPDNNSQSNMTVQEAINMWPELEKIGIPLSSPCPADYSSGWLDEFMQKAKELKYRVDFIAIHCYQDFSVSGVEKKMKTDVLDTIYEKYKLPIWLTEYGAIDISTWAGGGKYNPNCNEKAAKEYIENSTKLLEKLGYVERYAWFLDNFNETGSARPKEAPYTSLYNDDDTISSTGEIYKNIVSSKPLKITTKTLNDASINKDYYFQIEAEGGKGNYTFSSQNLPNGLSLSSGGQLYGKLSKNGEFNINITCNDENGQTTYKKYLLLVD